MAVSHNFHYGTNDGCRATHYSVSVERRGKRWGVLVLDDDRDENAAYVGSFESDSEDPMTLLWLALDTYHRHHEEEDC